MTDKLPLARAAALHPDLLTERYLRDAIASGKLKGWKIRGRLHTTAEAIEEMVDSCRVHSKRRGSASAKAARTVSGSSLTAAPRSGLDALKDTIKVLSDSYKSTSTTRVAQRRVDNVVLTKFR